MATNDLRRQIEQLHARIGRLTGELSEIRAKVAATAVKVENHLAFVRLRARDNDRLAA